MSRRSFRPLACVRLLGAGSVVCALLVVVCALLVAAAASSAAGVGRESGVGPGERLGCDRIQPHGPTGPLTLTTPGGTYYLHGDDLDSTTSVTNASGARQWTRLYEPFGVKRAETRHNTTAPAVPAQYAGEALDPTTGLYNLRARQYDPATGRFTATDPIDTPQTQPWPNPYGYVRGQATVLIDPSGQLSLRIRLPCPLFLCPEEGKQVALGAYDVARSTAESVAYLVAPPNWDDIVVNGSKFLQNTCGSTLYYAPAYCTTKIGLAIGKQLLDNIAGCLSTPDTRALTRQCIKAAASLYGVAKVTQVARTAALASTAARAAAAAKDTVVIGKLADLGGKGAIGKGERTLLDQLPDRGSEAANWAQNRRVVLNELKAGRPIRDASVDPATGELVRETGFLARERALLREQGWRYDPRTRHWVPGR